MLRIWTVSSMTNLGKDSWNSDQAAATAGTANLKNPENRREPNSASSASFLAASIPDMKENDPASQAGLYLLANFSYSTIFSGWDWLIAKFRGCFDTHENRT